MNVKEVGMGAKLPAGRKSGWGLGLAFIVGVLVFFSVFSLMKYYVGGGRSEKLIPAGDRVQGDLVSPIFWRPAGVPVTTKEPGRFSVADGRGKVVVANIFATWCGPCRAEMPELAAVAREYASKGAVFVGVSVDKEGESSIPRGELLKRFVGPGGAGGANELPFMVLLPNDDAPLMRGSFPIPQTFLYDKQGRRALTVIGQLDAVSLRRWLEELLKE